MRLVHRWCCAGVLVWRGLVCLRDVQRHTCTTIAFEGSPQFVELLVLLTVFALTWRYKTLVPARFTTGRKYFDTIQAFFSVRPRPGLPPSFVQVSCAVAASAAATRCFSSRCVRHPHDEIDATTSLFSKIDNKRTSALGRGRTCARSVYWVAELPRDEGDDEDDARFWCVCVCSRNSVNPLAPRTGAVDHGRNQRKAERENCSARLALCRLNVFVFDSS